MKLVTVEVEGKARPGRIANDHIVDLSSMGPDLRSILESGGLDRACSAEGSKIPLKGARLLAPIQNPAIVLSVGMNYHSSTGIMGPIHAWEQNLLGKMFPSFCPMGPVLATKEEVPDPGNVKIKTRLNGKLMQSANTDDLVFSVPKLIEYYSQFYFFKPGDVITTGSPSGVGYGRHPRMFMKAGDVVEVEVQGIGILRNPIQA